MSLPPTQISWKNIQMEGMKRLEISDTGPIKTRYKKQEKTIRRDRIMMTGKASAW
jgi:hypothetical protein